MSSPGGVDGWWIAPLIVGIWLGGLTGAVLMLAWIRWTVTHALPRSLMMDQKDEVPAEAPQRMRIVP